MRHFVTGSSLMATQSQAAQSRLHGLLMCRAAPAANLASGRWQRDRTGKRVIQS